MMSTEQIDSLRKKVRYKLLACPFFLQGALLPIFTYVSGNLAWEHLVERVTSCMDAWHGTSDEDKQLLAESYYQETDALTKLYRICQQVDRTAPVDESALQESLLKLLQDYADLPVVERQIYFL